MLDGQRDTVSRQTAATSWAFAWSTANPESRGRPVRRRVDRFESVTKSGSVSPTVGSEGLYSVADLARALQKLSRCRENAHVGHLLSSWITCSAAASITCSQLSNTSSAFESKIDAATSCSNSPNCMTAWMVGVEWSGHVHASQP